MDPLWGLFAATVVVRLLSVEGGYWLGKYRHRRSDKEKEAPVGAMVAATLGLLAFLLAFTFGFAASRFEARRQVLLDEVNALGTCYLRAGLLSEARREEIRKLLRASNGWLARRQVGSLSLRVVSRPTARRRASP